MDDLTPDQKKAIELLGLALDGGNDADLVLSERIESIEDKIDEVKKMEGPQGIQGEKGEQGIPGIDGKNGARGEKGDKGDAGERGEIGVPGLPGRDGIDGKDGSDGENGKNGIDGKDGSPDTPDQVVEKVIESSKLIPKRKIEGLDDLERTVKNNNFDVRIGVSKTEMTALTNRVIVTEKTAPQISKTLTFNADGSLNTCTDSNGSETMVYSFGILSAVTGTGIYQNKTFSYSDTLDSVTV